MLSGGGAWLGSGSDPRLQPPPCEGRAGAEGLLQMFGAGLSPGLARPVVCFKSFRMRRLSDKTINMGKGESITIHYLP